MARAEKRPPDERGGHVRLYWSLIDSHAWHALTHTEQAFYIAMRRHLKGSNNGNIEATAGTMAHYDFASKATIAKCLRSLLAVGLIAKTRQGLMAFGGKTCSLYRFTDAPCYDIPKFGVKASKATDEWSAWKSRAEAAAAVRNAHEAAKNPDHQNAKRQRSEGASKVRAVNLLGSPNEPRALFVGSFGEPCRAPLVQSVNHDGRGQIDRQPSPVLDSSESGDEIDAADHGSKNEPLMHYCQSLSASAPESGQSSNLLSGLLVRTKVLQPSQGKPST